MEIEVLGSPVHDSARAERTAESAAGYGQHTAIGTFKVFAAMALILPTGLLTAAFLTRKLGPELYGLFTVAATVVVWVELSTTLVFRRTTVKFVAEAGGWRTMASVLTQAQLLVSLAATALLVAAAPALAAWLRSPELATYLRLFALDIPIFALAHIHLSVLIGRGAFGQRALPMASRWLSRMVFIFVLVGLGLSVTGAILASIGASVVALIVARLFVRPALLSRSALRPLDGPFAKLLDQLGTVLGRGLGTAQAQDRPFPIRRLGGYALPLFFFALGMRLFNRLDLLVVKALSGSSEAAGFYGAALSPRRSSQRRAGPAGPLP